MADKKITQLTALTQASSVDVFPIVDVGASETKKIRVDDLFASPTAIGSVNPDTGSFTTLQLPTGSTINEFSIDGTLSGDSDTAVPTEKAVKLYVDSSVNNLNKIWQGDSSVIVTDTTAAPASITFTVDSILQGQFDSTGFYLASGVSVNEISNDPLLTDASQHTLVTEYAVKQYIDSQSTLPDRIVEGFAIAQVSDSTAESYFSVKVRDLYFAPDATALIFYFDDSTTSNWANPGNMVDGNNSTFAQAGSSEGVYIQLNTSNNAVASSTKFIEKVEFRVRGLDMQGPNISAFNIYPLFSGVQGNSQNLRSFFGPSTSWTPWIDITEDPAAPSEWQWSDVINLDTKVEAIIGHPGGGAGDIVKVNKIEIRVTYSQNPSLQGSVEKLRVDTNGLSTEFGTSVDEFSTDVLMADSSDKALPTERAVKTYVDTQIENLRHDVDITNIRHINSDATAVAGDVCLVNTGGGSVTIEMVESLDGMIIIKKISADTNAVTVTTHNSSIDGENSFVLGVTYASMTFICDGSVFYIV